MHYVIKIFDFVIKRVFLRIILNKIMKIIRKLRNWNFIILIKNIIIVFIY